MNKRILFLSCGLIALVLMLLSGCEEEGGIDDPDGGDTDTEPTHLDSLMDRSYFTDVPWLAAHLGEPGLVVIDTREAELYQAGHIEGAVNLIWQALANVAVNPGEKGFGVAVPIGQLSPILAATGMRSDSTVVVYGGGTANGWGDDGRVVWQLRMAGIAGAKILDGGLPLWTEAGHATVTTPAAPQTTDLVLTAYDPAFVADTAWMQANLTTAKIVDARALDEYNGAQLYGEARGGHLPGAIHLPFGDVVDEAGRIKHQSELDALFEAKGISKTDDIGIYCTAGIRSGFLAVVMRAVGYAQARNYDESFYWWAANDELPLE